MEKNITQKIKSTNEFDNVYLEEKTNFTSIYTACNKKYGRNCILKVIHLKDMEKYEYDYLLKRLESEEKLTKQCNSEYTVNLYQKILIEDLLIFELEECDSNLEKYMNNNSEFECKKDFFFKRS